MKQLRTTVRINIATSVVARLPDGTPIAGQTINIVTPHNAKLPDGRPVPGETIDMSSGGTSIRFPEAVDLSPNTQVRLTFPHPAPPTEIPAYVVSSEGSVLRVRFEDLTIAEQEVLTMVLYSRADSWLGWGESRKNDNVLRSMGSIFMISMHGLGATFKSLVHRGDKKVRKPTSLSVVRSAVILSLIHISDSRDDDILKQTRAALVNAGQSDGKDGDGDCRLHDLPDLQPRVRRCNGEDHAKHHAPNDRSQREFRLFRVRGHNGSVGFPWLQRLVGVFRK